MKHVIINIDDPGEQSQSAIQAAKAYVNAETTVYLFHNVYHRNIMNDSQAGDQVLDEARELLLESRFQRLQQLGREHFGDRLEVGLVWAESGWQELIRFANSHQADLVVTGSVRRSRWQRIGLSNDDWELIRHCPIPLLLTRASTPKTYRTIIAAVDPLHADDKPASLDSEIVKLACDFVDSADARVHVLNVIPMPVSTPSVMMSPVGPGPELHRDMLTNHHRKLDELVTLMDPETVDCVVKTGEPSREIVRYVKDQAADLVVMGAVSRSTFKRLLIGNTAETVLDALPCDVLVTKPPSFDARNPELLGLMGNAVTWPR